MKPQTSALLGQKVGHILVVDVLGEGGMGAVYVGFDDTLQRKVALKAIRSEFRLSEEARARFLREARILSQLDHPYVCTVFDYLEEDECDFLVSTISSTPQAPSTRPFPAFLSAPSQELAGASMQRNSKSTHGGRSRT